jgi:hypothetical protein
MSEERIDLTDQGECELSLIVFNTEHLYRRRRDRTFRRQLEQEFIFTEDQWDELTDDLNEEEA